ncbi:hypothetical protein K437DRAFT_276628 [Tilletiaria anomala UBC 951]|uniref:Uncharacterized protein n=1 Tax=Tilletiaria anomala (strain ATCC 24038 / CBS 436.72 / UBC 951) TaxID=1037660 RepID=A0A066V6Y0_TILAU|nr:uncharacterized protein K437DRAFT_276628 [Tilletiaria anomala UBC 951]KDN37231.1 hypothetical protein K437DRAFT_276628 [Tilletiaria anomala UBC 951]
MLLRKMIPVPPLPTDLAARSLKRPSAKWCCQCGHHRPQPWILYTILSHLSSILFLSPCFLPAVSDSTLLQAHTTRCQPCLMSLSHRIQEMSNESI